MEKKNALITGGVSGIGAAICEEFLRNSIEGVALIDIQEKEPNIVAQWREKYPSQKLRYYCYDVSYESAVRECYTKIINEFECIEIVVNCAGIFNENVYAKMVGVMHSSLLALEHMRTDRNGKGGFVINIVSTAGLYTYPLFPCYCASKYAVDDLYYKLFGVKFIAICPHLTKTPIIPTDISGLAFYPELVPELTKLLEQAPCQEPSDVANAVMEILNKEEPRGVWVVSSGKLTEHKYE